MVITRRDKPVAKLDAVAPVRRRPVFGSMMGLIGFDSFFDPLPDHELEL